MRKKRWIMLLSLTLVFLNMSNDKIYASSPYEGNEDAWLQQCSAPQNSEADAQACRDFKVYYSQKSNDLSSVVTDLQKSSDALKDDLSNLKEIIDEMNTKIETLDSEIATAEANVANMQASISNLDTQMAEKLEEIETLDALVKARMVSEQANIGTNRYVDVIMGAHDFVDFIRLVEGINLVTASDQDQIEAAAQARSELKLQQDEQERLKDDMELRAEEIVKQKEVAAQGKVEQEKVYDKYYAMQQEVLQKMETARADVSSMQGNIAGINTNVRDDIFQKPSEPVNPDDPESGNSGGEMGSGNQGWVKPVGYGLYCGTWYYPGGSVHLGADYSGPVGASVVAPADSIVLYANSQFDANQFGSMLGWPYGSGNSMHLLTQVNGVTYGVSYYHLSPGFSVSVGDLVKQGQVVARSGNSGNSYGAHLHVEVVNLGSMSITTAQAQFASTADFAWGSGWGISSTCDNRGAPCRIKPESVFGY